MRTALSLLIFVICLVFGASAVWANDDELASEIHKKLSVQHKSGQLTNFDLNVRVEDSVVWIKGKVFNTSQRDLILGTASRVRGVKTVVNELEVVPSRADRPQVGPITKVSVKQTQNLSAGPTTVASDLPKPTTPVKNDIFATATTVSNTQNRGKQIDLAALQQSTTQPQTAAALPNGPMQAQTTNRSIRRRIPVAFARARTLLQRGPQQGNFDNSRPAARPVQTNFPGVDAAAVPARYDNPNLPAHAWPGYSTYPNYGSLAYPQQYSAAAWPYIGPFYPYPQVPLGWRKVTLEWDDGWWYLDYKSK